MEFGDAQNNHYYKHAQGQAKLSDILQYGEANLFEVFIQQTILELYGLIDLRLLNKISKLGLQFFIKYNFNQLQDLKINK